jgi:hypothetical protein
MSNLSLTLCLVAFIHCSPLAANKTERLRNRFFRSCLGLLQTLVTRPLDSHKALVLTPEEKLNLVEDRMRLFFRERITSLGQNPPSRSQLVHYLLNQVELLPQQGTTLVIGPGANQWEWVLPLLSRPDARVLISEYKEMPAIQFLLTDGMRGGLESHNPWPLPSPFPRLSIQETEPLRHLWHQTRTLLDTEKTIPFPDGITDFEAFRALVQSNVSAFGDVTRRTPFLPHAIDSAPNTGTFEDSLRRLEPRPASGEFDVHPYSVATPIPQADAVFIVNQLGLPGVSSAIGHRIKEGTMVISTSFDSRAFLPEKEGQQVIEVQNTFFLTGDRELIRKRMRSMECPLYVWFYSR